MTVSVQDLSFKSQSDISTAITVLNIRLILTLSIFMCRTQETHAVAIETRAVYACLGQTA